MYDAYTELLNTSAKRKFAERLAEIEAEDKERCSSCGGEDCCCCEYYIDRQKWDSPEEMLDDSRWHGIY